jgi:hypothetical protein
VKYLYSVRTLTMREVIKNVKWLFDTGGKEHTLKLVKSMLEYCEDANRITIYKFVLWLIPLVFKMAICKKRCFENLDRSLWCRCSCGSTPPIKIRLDDERSNAWA